MSLWLQIPDGRVVMSFSSYFAGEHFEFAVTRTELEMSPRWLPDSPAPPLAIRDAVSVGRSKLVQLVPASADWTFRQVTLHPTQVENVWLYSVQFSPTPPTAVGGIVEPYRIMVLMDGRAVEPKRTSKR